MKTVDKRKAFGDVYGRQRPERLSEYFDFERWPEKAEKKVTRHELQVLLSQYHRALRYNSWYSRLWRWLTGRWGKPVEATPTPTQETTQEKGA